MLLASGAVVAAGIPVLLAGTSVAATIGNSAPLSHLVHAEPTVASMIVLIGMAVGVDYSLFYLSREREERARGRSTLDAVGSATFNSLATGAIVVVAVAVVGSITVLPALLVKLGRWVDRPCVPLPRRLEARLARNGSGSLSGRILATLPGDIAEVATLNRMATTFPSQGTTATVVVRTRAVAPAGDQAQVADALAALERQAVTTRRTVVDGRRPRHFDRRPHPGARARYSRAGTRPRRRRGAPGSARRPGATGAAGSWRGVRRGR